MREAANELDRDVARSLFRQHLARSGEILEAHAQAAMAEARGKVGRAAHILRERVRADATLQAEIDALDRLMQHAFPPIELPTPPPMYWPSRLPPSENPKRRTRKARKSNAKKI